MHGWGDGVMWGKRMWDGVCGKETRDGDSNVRRDGRKTNLKKAGQTIILR